ncbi:MAG: hypothetical protein ACK5S5_07780 [Planctomycetota bacterium]
MQRSLRAAGAFAGAACHDRDLVRIRLFDALRLGAPRRVLLIAQPRQRLAVGGALGELRARGLGRPLRLLAALLQPPLVPPQPVLERLRQRADRASVRRLLGAVAQALRRRLELLIERGQRRQRRREIAARDALQLRAQAQHGGESEAETAHGGAIGRAMGES